MKDYNPTYEFFGEQRHKRLRELILYVARKLQGDETYGRTKLAKVLYFADMASYQRYGQPITGFTYVKWEHGPVPEGYLDILDEMASSNEIVTQEVSYFNKRQKRVISMREPDLTTFNGRDIDLVNQIIQREWGKNATDISESSHGIAWRAAIMNKRIPYEASLLSDEPPTASELEHAMKLAEELGLE